MKGVLIGFLLVISATSSARSSIDTAKVVATVEGHHLQSGIDMIALLDDGRMQIRRGTDVQTVRLKNHAVLKLAQDALILNDARIKTVKNPNPCRNIRWIPKLSELSVSSFSGDIATGNLRVVLTRDSCVVDKKTYPEDEIMRRHAYVLREELIALALNTDPITK